MKMEKSIFQGPFSQNFIFSVEIGPNKLECFFMSGFFYPSLIFVRCSTLMVGSWPYPQTLYQAGEAYHGQTYQLISLLVKLFSFKQNKLLLIRPLFCKEVGLSLTVTSFLVYLRERQESTGVEHFALCKHQTKTKVMDSDKRTSLQHCSINYQHKKNYLTGSRRILQLCKSREFLLKGKAQYA